jgi:hypothetical protein
MTSLLGIAVLVVLFLAFPFIKRERAGGCSGKGCWKKKLGIGCGECPLDQAPPPSDTAARNGHRP